jgi:hypothetical protein
MDYFSGRGAKDVLPLYRDASAQYPNIHPALCDLLTRATGRPVSAEDIAAYLYAVLAHPEYTVRFQQELENREVRVPITLDTTLFAEAVTIGQRLIYLHSYGERFARNQTWPQGRARNTRAISTDNLPENFSYDAATQTLSVGDGRFHPVAAAIWEFEVSGLKVVQSWFGYRMRNRKGKKSSPLDDITPEAWRPEFTSELIRLLHLLEATLELYPKQAVLLEHIIESRLLLAEQLGAPPEEYRKAPASHEAQGQLGI